MDKDVEVSRDQNTIVVDGIRYKAEVYKGQGSACHQCQVPAYHGHAYCSVIPCDSAERRDGNLIFLTTV